MPLHNIESDLANNPEQVPSVADMYADTYHERTQIEANKSLGDPTELFSVRNPV